MKISDAEIKLADAFLLQFCCKVEKLYGKDIITPNMHLHCHIKQSLFDYGPIHNFWLFSYERYNGILESIPSNNRSIEIQLMKKFYKEFTLFSSSRFLPDEYQSDFGALMATHLQPTLKGSLHVTIHGKYADLMDPRLVQDWSLQASSSQVVLPKSYVRSVLCESMQSQLQQTYTSLYPKIEADHININATVQKYSSIAIEGINFSSKVKLVVYVTDRTSLTSRPVLLNYFVLHSFYYEDTPHQHAFAVVTWLKNHPAKEFFSKPLELWWKELVDAHLDVFVPIQLLICHSAYCEVKHEEQTVYLMCPIRNIPKLQ